MNNNTKRKREQCEEENINTNHLICEIRTNEKESNSMKRKAKQCEKENGRAKRKITTRRGKK